MDKKADVQNIRMYEYIDEDGNVFWSFSETSTRIQHRRLELVDRVGLPFNRWNYELRRLVRISLLEKVEDLSGVDIVEEKNWGIMNKPNRKPKNNK